MDLAKIAGIALEDRRGTARTENSAGISGHGYHSRYRTTVGVEAAYAAAFSGQFDTAVQHTASGGIAVDQGQYGIRICRSIRQLDIACKCMTVKVQSQALVTQVEEVCKLNVAAQPTRGNSRVQSFLQPGLGGNVAGDPFRFQRDISRNSFSKIIFGITVVPTGEGMLVPCGIAGLQCHSRTDIDKQLGRDETASAVQIKADSVIRTVDRAVFIHNSAVVNTAVDRAVRILKAAVIDTAVDRAVKILELAVVDTAVDGTGIENRAVESGAAIGACALDRAASHSIFDYTAVGVHDFADHDTVCLLVSGSTALNDAAFHGKGAASPAIHTAAAAVPDGAVVHGKQTILPYDSHAAAVGRGSTVIYGAAVHGKVGIGIAVHAAAY